MIMTTIIDIDQIVIEVNSSILVLYKIYAMLHFIINVDAQAINKKSH